MPRLSTSAGVMTFTLYGLGPLPAKRRPDIVIEGRIGRLPAEQPIPDSARRTLRQNQRLAERERARAAALAFQPKVQAGFRPPPGKLCAVNEAAQLIIGPAGAIGTTAAVARVLRLSRQAADTMRLALPQRPDAGMSRTWASC